jgi:hypothetical protein
MTAPQGIEKGKPALIDFQQIGDLQIGFISVAENLRNIPFEIKRVYWVYGTPEEIERGNHANRSSEQILISLTGTVDIFLENQKGLKYHFLLKNLNQGLYVPAMHWRKLKMGKEVVCLSLSSSLFDEEDYIRDYNEFLNKK